MPPTGRLGCSADFSPRIQTSETGEKTKGRKARITPMKCELCGKEFQPSGHGRPQKYCGKSCRQKADYRRKKNNPARTRKSKPAKAKRKPEQELDRRNFERMMDGSHEDTLREIVGRLREALHDPSTPANALPSISSKLAEFDARMRMAEESGSLFDVDDAVTEVAEDVGASIV